MKPFPKMSNNTDRLFYTWAEDTGFATSERHSWSKPISNLDKSRWGQPKLRNTLQTYAETIKTTPEITDIFGLLLGPNDKLLITAPINEFSKEVKPHTHSLCISREANNGFMVKTLDNEQPEHRSDKSSVFAKTMATLNKTTHSVSNPQYFFSSDNNPKSWTNVCSLGNALSVPLFHLWQAQSATGTRLQWSKVGQRSKYLFPQLEEKLPNHYWFSVQKFRKLVTNFIKDQG